MFFLLSDTIFKLSDTKVLLADTQLSVPSGNRTSISALHSALSSYATYCYYVSRLGRGRGERERDGCHSASRSQSTVSTAVIFSWVWGRKSRGSVHLRCHRSRSPPCHPHPHPPGRVITLCNSCAISDNRIFVLLCKAYLYLGRFCVPILSDYRTSRPTDRPTEGPTTTKASIHISISAAGLFSPSLSSSSLTSCRRAAAKMPWRGHGG